MIAVPFNLNPVFCELLHPYVEVDHIDLEGPTMLSVPGHDEKAEFGVITSFAYPFAVGRRRLNTSG